VAGSGAVPNFSMLKGSLHSHKKLKHIFICANKTWADICFRETLASLEKAHPERLSVIHALTREADLSHFGPPSKEASGSTGPKVREGRITHALLQELVPEPTRAFFYLCGPAITAHDRRIQLESGTPAEPRFLERMLDFVEQLGVPKTQVKREAY
jgi:ferredoxin-NADP reductase